MTDEKKEKLSKLADTLRPLAKDIIALAKTDTTTKDGYGRVLQFLLGLESKNTRFILLLAMSREGYPIDTVEALRQLI